MKHENSPVPAASFRMGKYSISTDRRLLDLDTIYAYLSEESYWAAGVEKSVVERSIQHSLCFGLYVNTASTPGQIGFARLITDYSTFGHLSDVFVLADYRGMGLGKWLVKTILDYPELQTLRLWSLNTKDAQLLYRRFGFDEEKNSTRYLVYRPDGNQPIRSERAQQ